MPADDSFMDELASEESGVIMTDSYSVNRRDASRAAKMRDISNAIGAYYSDREAYPMPDGNCITRNVLSESYIEGSFPSDPIENHFNGCGMDGAFGYAVGKANNGAPQFLLVSYMETPE